MESHVQYREKEASWTNEKHVDFLNSMEASFVRSMFENRIHFHHHHHHRRLRLDRHLPDSSDSTLDSSKTPPRHNGKTYTTSGCGRIDGRSDNRSRRRLSRPFNSTQDQVVPQMEKRDDGDKDDRDHPMAMPNSSVN